MEQPDASPQTPIDIGTAWTGTRVLVLGLGQSGLAMARWCAQAGAQVTVADTRLDPPQLATLRAEVPSAQFVSADLTPGLLDQVQAQAVFKSPGLAPADLAELWQAAQDRGIRCDGELGLFVQALNELRRDTDYSPQILAVTGTNGKTTVTSLTGILVERAGKHVAVAGNIGPSLLDTLGQCLSAGRLPDVWVLELSSFQLADCAQFEPTVATILNVTQDHLDWHGTMQAYVQAKAKIFGQEAQVVLNRDDPQVRAIVDALNPVAVARVGSAKPIKAKGRRVVSFGLDLPTQPGDFGLELVNGMTWLVRAMDAEETGRARKSGHHDDSELYLQRLMPADALRIRGRHNSANALAALALAAGAGCSLAPMLFGLREYRGEPHRVESVAVIHEVEYFDDSKGTNVGATAAALNGLGAERRVVVILGGVGKGQDFAPLREPVARYARAVILIGRDAGLIASELQGLTVPLVDAASMTEAVRAAQLQARAGDAVLLSPACASFDMFNNYEHRAAAFVQAVAALAEQVGVTLESRT